MHITDQEIDNDPVSIILSWGKIMTMCEDFRDCHKDADYWLPEKNMQSVCLYIDMNGGRITSDEMMQPLIKSRLIMEMPKLKVEF